MPPLPRKICLPACLQPSLPAPGDVTLTSLLRRCPRSWHLPPPPPTLHPHPIWCVRTGRNADVLPLGLAFRRSRPERSAEPGGPSATFFLVHVWHPRDEPGGGVYNASKSDPLVMQYVTPDTALSWGVRRGLGRDKTGARTLTETYEVALRAYFDLKAIGLVGALGWERWDVPRFSEESLEQFLPRPGATLEVVMDGDAARLRVVGGGDSGEAGGGVGEVEVVEEAGEVGWESEGSGEAEEPGEAAESEE